jgi:rhodanese-related sulfurtransferase
VSIPTIELSNVPAELPEGVVVLDVREPEEWAAGHIEDAVHIPLGTLPVRLQDLPDAQQFLVVCKMGGRSAQACMYLGQQGLAAVNLAGGMVDWAAAGRPMVSETGQDPYVA